MDPSSYQQTYDSLAGQYQPQTDLINSQIADLPRQQQAVTDSLNQAKVNAFKDITNSANAKGVLFSGVPIDQQATYTGKYLGALTNLQQSFNNQKNTLLGQINTLQAGRQRQAQDSVSAYQKSQQDNAYKQAQLDLGYARLNSSNANSAANRAARNSGGLTAYQQLEQTQKAQGAFGMKQGSNGQYMFNGANNKPVNMANYLQGSGSTGQDLINLLANGTGYDRGVLSKLKSNSQFKQIMNNQDSNALAALVKKYDTGRYYGF